MTAFADRSSSRLASSDSPYLLQHAANPVQWWPWGVDAFEEARRRDVPILLSIGYATCHWCHVMARESFESHQTAQKMNADFVCIKVDREQHPAVDDLTMQACQLFTEATEGRASGGWPLTAFLEPRAGHPFFIGTYFPPQPAFGRASFTQVLTAIAQAWRTRRADLLEQARRLSVAVADAIAPADPAAAVAATTLARARHALLQSFDAEEGGFGGAPKFPQPSLIRLLAGDPSPSAQHAVRHTLTRMALGGIHDHVAGGFHRYAVDDSWTVPHFEKMLYDQALLAPLYAQYGGHGGDAWLREVCERLLAFVDRELSLPRGGFFCALDADVDHREGAGHVWRPLAARESLRAHGLDDADCEFVLTALGLEGAANFRDPHHPEDPPAWVIRCSEVAAAADERVRRGLAALHHTRQGWEQPIRDDKVILCWNAWMISAFAQCSVWLNRPQYGDRATSALQWTFEHLRPRGEWLRCWRQGNASTEVALEDLAALMQACIDTSEATADVCWLTRASEVYADARRMFFTDDTARWSDAQAGDSLLHVRPSSRHDGAVPSGTSTMLHAMTMLLGRRSCADLRSDLLRSARAVATTMNRTPLAMAFALPLTEQWSTLIPEVFAETTCNPQPPLSRVQSRLGIEAWRSADSLWLKIPEGLEVRSTDQRVGGIRLVGSDGAGMQVLPTVVARRDQDGGWLRGTVELHCTDLARHARVSLSICACGDGMCHPEETMDLARVTDH